MVCAFTITSTNTVVYMCIIVHVLYQNTPPPLPTNRHSRQNQQLLVADLCSQSLVSELETLPAMTYDGHL